MSPFSHYTAGRFSGVFEANLKCPSGGDPTLPTQHLSQKGQTVKLRAPGGASSRLLILTVRFQTVCNHHAVYGRSKPHAVPQ